MTVHLRQVIKTIISESLEGLYTSLPAEVVDYDSATQTATVQPLINYRYEDGVVLEEPVISNVPVIFPSAGGGILSFPVERGDTLLVCFSMRSIDGWVESNGGKVTPSERRLHELTDAIAIPGLYPKKNAQQTNSEDVEVKFKGNRVTLKANGDIELEGGRIDLGEGASEAIVLGDAFRALFNTHTHPDPSSGSTGAPTQQMGPSHLSDKVFSE